MVTVIDKPTTGNVTVQDDALYLTNTGSITNSGLALTLKCMDRLLIASEHVRG